MGVKQGTTVTSARSRGLGKRDTASLVAAYPGSPLLQQNVDAVTDDGSLGADCKMRAWYQANVLDGSTDTPDANGESRANPDFPGLNLDYGNNSAPDLTTIGTTADDADLKDGSPYLPNLASPDATTGIKPPNPAARQPQGHSGENGSVQTPAASSNEQQLFKLTNLPGLGDSPPNS